MSAAVAGAGAMLLVGAAGARVAGRLRRPTIAHRRHEAPAGSPRRRAALVTAGVLTGGALAALTGPLPVIAVVTVGVLARWWLVRRDRLRRAAAIRRTYPDAIDLVVLAIRAGLLPPAALDAAAAHLAGPVRSAFAEVGSRRARGERFADALAALTDALGDTARPMVDSLAAADRYGLPIAPVLERLAAEARADRRRAADAAARQLPVRLAAPLVACTLPSFVLLAIVPLLVGAFSSWRLP